MRKVVFAFIILFSLHSVALASDWQVNFQFSRADGGSLSGEVWYNNDMVWRLKIQADGALPAISGNDPRVTVLVPDIVDGLFVLKVHR